MIPQGALLSPHPRSWLSCCLKFLYVWLSLRSLWLIDFHDTPGSTPFPPSSNLAIMLPQVRLCLTFFLQSIDFHDTLDHVTQIVHIDYYWLILFKFNSYLGILKSLANIPVWIWSHLFHSGNCHPCKHIFWVYQVEDKVLHVYRDGGIHPFIVN